MREPIGHVEQHAREEPRLSHTKKKPQRVEAHRIVYQRVGRGNHAPDREDNEHPDAGADTLQNQVGRHLKNQIPGEKHRAGAQPLAKFQASVTTNAIFVAAKRPDGGGFQCSPGAVKGFVPGTFALDLAADCNPVRGPDIIVTHRWNAEPNPFGVAGTQWIPGTAGQPAHNGHGGLNPFVTHSTLLAAGFGLLPGDDERMVNTVVAIADELTEDGFVLRYRTGETDDGLSGKEGSFLICSFWLVSALAIVGEHERARDLMEKLLRVGSPLGLYAEEFDPSSARFLGNFPQAFSHLALIEAAGRIIVAERLAEIS
jgi:hypothetical protein